MHFSMTFLLFILTVFIVCTRATPNQPLNKVRLADIKATHIAFNKPKPPPFYEVVLHQSLSITCEAASINGPAPVVFWQKKGQIVAALESNELQYLSTVVVVASSTKSILHIECVLPTHLGLYSCIAETNTTRIVTDMTIVLLPGHVGRSTLYKRAKCEKPKGIDFQPPKILMWTRNTLQEQWTNATLFCRATGIPTPFISWEIQHGGSNFEGQISRIPFNQKKHQILPSGDLQIFDLNWKHDMGVYVCTAQNSIGRDRAEAFLYPVKPAH